MSATPLRQITRNALSGLVLGTSVTALCLAPGAAGAQVVDASSSIASADTLARLKYSTITDQFLIELHANLVAALKKQSGSEGSSGAFVAPPLVSYLADNISLDGYSGAGASSLEYNTTNAAARGVFHRVCANPDQQGQYYALSYMIPAEGYKYELTATQMQAAAPQYFAARHQEFMPDVSGTGLVTVTGNTQKTGSFTPWGGTAQALPDCVMNGPGLPDFANGTYLAEFSQVFIAGSGVKVWKSFAHKWASCPPATAPGETIGIALMEQETDTAKKLDGTVVSTTTKPWAYLNGCAEPRTETRNILRRCTYPFMNTTAVGFQTYSQLFKQVANPDVKPDPKNALKQWSWQIDTSSAPKLLSSSCPGASPATPFSETAVSNQTQTRTLACSAVYPNPQPYPYIPYIGAFGESRAISTTTETLPAGSNPPTISATSYGPWNVTTNSCQRTYQVTSQQQSTQNCPSGYVGSIIQTRTATTTTTQYASGSPGPQSSTSYGGLTTTSNTCHLYCYKVPQGHGEYYTICGNGEPAGGGGGSGSWQDTSTLGSQLGATSAGQAAGMANSGSNEGSGGSSGGCFITTAVCERRGEEDDGPTLTAMRAFRDEWLRLQVGGPEIIAEYYRDAPMIVAAIPAEDPEWDRIAEEVDATVAAWHRGAPEDACTLYLSMVRRLQAAYLAEGASV